MDIIGIAVLILVIVIAANWLSHPVESPKWQIDKLRLSPDDILVIHLDGRFSRAEADEILENFKKATKGKIKYSLVISEGITLSTITEQAGEDIFHLEYVDADTVRLTRIEQKNK